MASLADSVPLMATGIFVWDSSIRPTQRPQLRMHTHAQIRARQAHPESDPPLHKVPEYLHFAAGYEVPLRIVPHPVEVDRLHSSPCQLDRTCRPGWSSPLRIAQIPTRWTNRPTRPRSPPWDSRYRCI